MGTVPSLVQQEVQQAGRVLSIEVENVCNCVQRTYFEEVHDDYVPGGRPGMRVQTEEDAPVQTVAVSLDEPPPMTKVGAQPEALSRRNMSPEPSWAWGSADQHEIPSPYRARSLHLEEPPSPRPARGRAMHQVPQSTQLQSKAREEPPSPERRLPPPPPSPPREESWGRPANVFAFPQLPVVAAHNERQWPLPLPRTAPVPLQQLPAPPQLPAPAALPVGFYTTSAYVGGTYRGGVTASVAGGCTHAHSASALSPLRGTVVPSGHRGSMPNGSMPRIGAEGNAGARFAMSSAVPQHVGPTPAAQASVGGIASRTGSRPGAPGSTTRQQSAWGSKVQSATPSLSLPRQSRAELPGSNAQHFVFPSNVARSSTPADDTDEVVQVRTLESAKPLLYTSSFQPEKESFGWRRQPLQTVQREVASRPKDTMQQHAQIKQMMEQQRREEIMADLKVESALDEVQRLLHGIR